MTNDEAQTIARTMQLNEAVIGKKKWKRKDFQISSGDTVHGYVKGPWGYYPVAKEKLGDVCVLTHLRSGFAVFPIWSRIYETQARKAADYLTRFLEPNGDLPINFISLEQGVIFLLQIFAVEIATLSDIDLDSVNMTTLLRQVYEC